MGRTSGARLQFRPVRAGSIRSSGPDSLLPVLRHDGHARAAHGDWPRSPYLSCGSGCPSRVPCQLLCTGRNDRPLLALRRHRLDISLPIALPDWTPQMTAHVPIPTVRILVAVWAALILLTVTTVSVSYLELGEWNIVLALTIAL